MSCVAPIAGAACAPIVATPSVKATAAALRQYFTVLIATFLCFHEAPSSGLAPRLFRVFRHPGDCLINAHSWDAVPEMARRTECWSLRHWRELQLCGVSAGKRGRGLSRASRRVM